jgi:RNA polymerase sigma-70 factor, ECF subfamily
LRTTGVSSQRIRRAEAAPGRGGPDEDSLRWIRRLRTTGPERVAALAELHEMLFRAARFEVARRHVVGPHLRGGDQEDLAQQSADDALVSILAKLDEFRGDSRFTTWAYKFALYEAAAHVRKRNWQGREIPLTDEAWPKFADEGRRLPDERAQSSELFTALRRAIESELSSHQREVLLAVAVNDVPIDVLADRLSTTRGALYKTIHDARRKLRVALAAGGLSIQEPWASQ